MYPKSGVDYVRVGVVYRRYAVVILEVGEGFVVVTGGSLEVLCSVVIPEV